MTWLAEAREALGFGAGAGTTFFAGKWLLEWFTGRSDKRQAQLDNEHASLDMSWRDYRLNLERRMKDIENSNETFSRQGRALRMAFEHVAGALIRKDPNDPALAIAERILAEAFPNDFTLFTARLDEADANHGRQTS